MDLFSNLGQGVAIVLFRNISQLEGRFFCINAVSILAYPCIQACKPTNSRCHEKCELTMLETMISVFTFLLSLILTFYFGVPKLHDMATAETLKAEHSKLLSCLLVAECCSATCLQSLYSRHPSWYGGAATGSLHYSRITSHWPPLVLKFKSARPFQEMCFLHKDSICQNVVCWFGTVIHKVVQVVHLRVRRCFQDLTRERENAHAMEISPFCMFGLFAGCIASSSSVAVSGSDGTHNTEGLG